MFKKIPDLLPNEQFLADCSANFVIQITDYNLSKFCADGLMWTIGMKEKEAIGGWLFFTNFRIIFSSHSFNRVSGQLSIPIDIIEKFESSSFLISGKFFVFSEVGRFEFIVWNAKKLVMIAEKQKRDFRPASWRATFTERQLSYTKEMKIFSFMEKTNKFFNSIGILKKYTDVVTNPLTFIQDAITEKAIKKIVEDPINRWVGSRKSK